MLWKTYLKTDQNGIKVVNPSLAIVDWKKKRKQLVILLLKKAKLQGKAAEQLPRK